MSAIRSQGGLRMAGMGADELREGPCSSVGEAGACASGRSRTFYCEFLRVSVRFVILAMLFVSVGMSREVHFYSIGCGGSID